MNPSLGVSDHATIIFDFICTYKEIQSGSVKMQYSKCDTQGFEAEWETINWDEKFKDLDLDDMSLVVRKPVFGISDQVRHKLGCTTTEDV